MSPSRPRVGIIGGGITGLTAAYTLERETDLDVVLIESESVLGGKIQTFRSEGLTIEAGPDSIFTAKRAAFELIDELNLNDEIVEPVQTGFHLLIGSTLHPVPRGLSSLSSVSVNAIEQASFLTADAKRQALDEINVPAGDGKDESLSDFFTRRFGIEFSQRVAEPILAGTHAGNPSKLSMRALYPSFLEKEQRDGHLSSREELRPTAKPAFISFRNGIQTLVDTLAKSLDRTHIGLAEIPMRFETGDRRVKLWTDEYPYSHDFDHVLLAVPSESAMNLLRDVEGVPKLLSKIRSASSFVLTVAYPATALKKELCGTGFLTPYNAEEQLAGCTWTSNKWPNRAPENTILIRYFIGGDGRPQSSHNERMEIVRKTSREVLGIEADPSFVEEIGWDCAFPQYELGHTELVDEIERALDATPFSVAGSSYRGVGIPDCIRQGREAARKIAEKLS